MVPPGERFWLISARRLAEHPRLSVGSGSQDEDSCRSSCVTVPEVPSPGRVRMGA